MEGKCVLFIEGPISDESREVLINAVKCNAMELVLFDHQTRNHLERKNKLYSANLIPEMYVLWDKESDGDEKTIVLHYFNKTPNPGPPFGRLPQFLRFELDFGLSFYHLVMLNVETFHSVEYYNPNDSIYRLPL